MNVPGIPNDPNQLAKDLEKLMKGLLGANDDDEDEKPKQKDEVTMDVALEGLQGTTKTTIEAFKVDVDQDDCKNPRDVHQALQNIFTDMIQIAGRLKKVASQLDDMIPASIVLSTPKPSTKKKAKDVTNDDVERLKKELKENLEMGSKILNLIKELDKKKKGDNE